MIRFACPACSTPYEVPDANAGHKTNCPRCGQRLQVPIPPPSKTMLAPLVAHHPDAPSVPAPPATAPMATWVLPTAVTPDQGEPPARIYAVSEGYRRPLWPFLVASGVALVLIGLGLRLLLTGGHLRDAGAAAENRSHARTDHEELVKRYILGIFDKDDDAAKVEFLTWGPHLSKQEWLALLAEAGVREATKPCLFGGRDLRKMEDIDALIRVRFRVPKRDWRAEIEEAQRALTEGRKSDPQNLPFTMKTLDFVFIVKGKMVEVMDSTDRGINIVGELNEEGGDNWKGKMRKRMAKRFPGIKPRARPAFYALRHAPERRPPGPPKSHPRRSPALTHARRLADAVGVVRVWMSPPEARDGMSFGATATEGRMPSAGRRADPPAGPLRCAASLLPRRPGRAHPVRSKPCLSSSAAAAIAPTWPLWSPVVLYSKTPWGKTGSASRRPWQKFRLTLEWESATCSGHRDWPTNRG